MAPFKIRIHTVRQLRNTVVQMMSPEWHLAMRERTKEEIDRAGRVLLETQAARLRIGNAALVDIRDSLKENEEGLFTGIERLKTALAKLQQVTQVLNAAEGLLSVVTKVRASDRA